MIHLQVNIEVRPAWLADFTELVTAHRRASLAEPDCLDFRVELRGKYHFMLTEKWADQSALNAHRGYPHYRRWRSEVADMERSHERIEREERIVVAPGCFDGGIHPGHIHLLTEARKLGDRLIVALNSDASVARLKGRDRPIVGEQDRAACLRALRVVDEVIIFCDPDPSGLLAILAERHGPIILVKGAETRRPIPEASVPGVEVRIVERLAGYSTTRTLERIRG